MLDNPKILEKDYEPGMHTNSDSNTHNINNINIINIDENFYHRYNKLITGIVTRILNFNTTGLNFKHDVEDCTNEIFAVLLSKIGEYEPERGTIETYISIISRSVALNFRKKLYKLQQVTATQRVQTEFSCSEYSSEKEIPDKFDEYNMFADTEAIKEIIMTLTQNEKILFTLKYIYYFKASEIAEYYDISVASAEKRSTRLRKKLQKLFKAGGLEY